MKMICRDRDWSVSPFPVDDTYDKETVPMWSGGAESSRRYVLNDNVGLGSNSRKQSIPQTSANGHNVCIQLIPVTI